MSESQLTNPDHVRSLETAIKQIQADGAPQYQIDHFVRQFHRCALGFEGFVREADIVPIEQPLTLSVIEDEGHGSGGPYKIASLKLNGGLGTTMGLDSPKSLLPIKDYETFLSIVLKQLGHDHQGDRLLLMNSFYTDDKTMAALQESVAEDVRCFRQGRIPRLHEGSLAPLDPAGWGEAAWCPPGHGQVLDILVNDLAAELLADGIRYVFISNIDNLGAIVDRRVPTYMQAHDIGWLTEGIRRGPLDIKGGHIAQFKESGRLLIRDSNMVDPADETAYTDVTRHAFFNTGNHWLDLTILSKEPDNGQTDLPLIVNHKQVTRGELEAQVIQLETGIGTAIGLFDSAQVLEVPRTRFIPVKDIAQWLVLRSDWFKLEADGVMTESDYTKRPAIDPAKIKHGTAKQTLEYYLSHAAIDKQLTLDLFV